MKAMGVRTRVLGFAAALVLGGCAVAPTTPSVLVLPGSQKAPAQFQADAAACRDQAYALVAPQVDAANNQAAASAVIGTAIGAGIGALFGSGGGYYYNNNAAVAWGAGTGLLFGSAVGSGNAQASSYSLQQRFDIAYMQCMYQVGNQIPGQASYVRRQRVAPAVPPPNQRAPNLNLYAPPGAPAVPPPNTLPPAGAPPA
jgi:uncharacterized protein YcfJ